MFHKVKVTAISFKPRRWDKEGNADRLGVPEAPSPGAAAVSEKLHFEEQAVEMNRRYRKIDEIVGRSRHVTR